MSAGAAKVSFETKCVAYLSAVLSENGIISNRAPCTGFFWRWQEQVYLITNRHCVTGRDHTNQPLPDTNWMPNQLQIYFRVPDPVDQDGARRYNNRAIAAILWKDGLPDWIEHPRGKEIDLAAVKLTDFPDTVHCVNDKQQHSSVLPVAGADCFILGYPEGLGGSEGTPIWKRASIATEPQLPHRGLPIFLCDTATRSGMSGSPVFLRAMGDFGEEGRQFLTDEWPRFFGYWTKFIGVYSGRNGNEKNGFQLGRVWHASLIEEMLVHGCSAECPWPGGCRRS